MPSTDGPDKEAVIALRLRVQRHYTIDELTAQGRCAKAIRASVLSWQLWESGERRMHPAVFELLQLRVDAHPKLQLVRRTQEPDDVTVIRDESD